MHTCTWYSVLYLLTLGAETVTMNCAASGWNEDDFAAMFDDCTALCNSGMHMTLPCWNISVHLKAYGNHNY